MARNRKSYQRVWFSAGRASKRHSEAKLLQGNSNLGQRCTQKRAAEHDLDPKPYALCLHLNNPCTGVEPAQNHFKYFDHRRTPMEAAWPLLDCFGLILSACLAVEQARVP